MRRYTPILVAVALIGGLIWAVRASSNMDCKNIETVKVERPKAGKFGGYIEKYEYRRCADNDQ